MELNEIISQGVVTAAPCRVGEQHFGGSYLYKFPTAIFMDQYENLIVAIAIRFQKL